MTSVQTGWLTEDEGGASGVALLDDENQTDAGGAGFGVEAEPWRAVSSPLCDDGKKFSDEDEEEDLDDDDLGDDADDESGEFDDDDDLEDEDDEMFEDESDEDDDGDDMDDDEDDDF